MKRTEDISRKIRGTETFAQLCIRKKPSQEDAILYLRWLYDTKTSAQLLLFPCSCGLFGPSQLCGSVSSIRPPPPGMQQNDPSSGILSADSGTRRAGRVSWAQPVCLVLFPLVTYEQGSPPDRRFGSGRSLDPRESVIRAAAPA